MGREAFVFAFSAEDKPEPAYGRGYVLPLQQRVRYAVADACGDADIRPFHIFPARPSFIIESVTTDISRHVWPGPAFQTLNASGADNLGVARPVRDAAHAAENFAQAFKGPCGR